MSVYHLDMAAASGSFHARCGLSTRDVDGASSIRSDAQMEREATNVA